MVNAKEFSKQQEITMELKNSFYFCRNFHTFESGAIENFILLYINWNSIAFVSRIRHLFEMKKLIFIFVFLSNILGITIQAQQLPDTIATGPFRAGHIQGMAIDLENGYMYCSYTTMLIKTDLEGNLIGSVTGLLGHLGDLDFHAESRRVYGSLEYKNDAIGKGVLELENSNRKLQNGFYIAIFDVDKIDRIGMNAEKDGVMKTVYLPTVLDDYQARVVVNGMTLKHRFGCSGIDGVSFGPKFGKTDGKEYLTVAYGIYSDNERQDNDYQVLLQYDIKHWGKYETKLSQDNMHTQGPDEPDGKYFVFTGNTTYGVQNLEYDAYSRKWFMAVYRGSKPQYPNHALFAIDACVKPVRQSLENIPYLRKAWVLNQVEGWDLNVGSTGICSLDNGYFYISHSYKINEAQGSKLYLYKYDSEGMPLKITH